MKLRIWWKPNFLPTNFEVNVISVLNAYVVAETCAALDLGIDIFNILEMFPNKRLFIEDIAEKYKEYRRKHSINSAHLITDNMHGLEYFDTDEKEWLGWANEDGETLGDINSWNEPAEVIAILKEYDSKNYNTNQ